VKVPAAKEAPAKPQAEKVQTAKTEPAKAPAVKEAPAKPPAEKVRTAKTEPVKAPAVKEAPAKPPAQKLQTAKTEPVKVPAVKEAPAKLPVEKVQTAKTEPVKETPAKPPAEKVQTAKTEPMKAPALGEPPATLHLEKAQTAKVEAAKAPAKKEPSVSLHSEKAQTAKVEPVKAPAAKEPAASSHAEKAQTAKIEPVKAPAVKEPVSNSRSEKAQTAKIEPVKAPAVKEPSAILPPAKLQTAAADSAKMPAVPEPTVNVQLLNRSMETASTRLADGFDFPVGKPDAEGYYRARGYRAGGHQGEDWDGVRGGDTDFKDPIYCIGDGIVVFARDVHLGWGNVVIVRHAYRESGTVKHIDSLYGHLNSILVRRGQKIARGQQIGTMGTAHGQYDAHLHLEIRKNLEIGMSRSKFQKNLSNYYDPSQFIASHRQLSGGGANFRVAMNTFTHDSAYHFDDSRNFSARKRSTAESSAALKRAISSTTR
jgi:murein DD-endopeptidase MepM/ murein hydrolase activator NlpD